MQNLRSMTSSTIPKISLKSKQELLDFAKGLREESEALNNWSARAARRNGRKLKELVIDETSQKKQWMELLLLKVQVH